LVIILRGMDMPYLSNYKAAVNYISNNEARYLQQGNHIDVSSYSFNELMKELNHD